MKKNQVLQLLLILQLLIVVVLVVSFWDRFRGTSSVQQVNSVQQSSCNTCSTCSTCQSGLQTYQSQCPTCGGTPQIGLNRIEIQTVVNDAVNNIVNTEVESAVDAAVKQRLDNAMASELNGVVDSAVNTAVSSAVDNALTDAMSEKLDTAVKSAVANAVPEAVSSAVNDAVDSKVAASLPSAVDSAVKEAENRFLSSNVSNPQQSADNLDSADGAQLANSRGYAPNPSGGQADGVQAQLTVPVPPALPSPAEVAAGEFDSVPDAVKALAAEETDDFDALASRTSNFKSTENSFETSSDILFEGSALKFKPETSEDVLTVFRGGAVDDDGVFIFKRFGEDHTILAVNSPPSTEPFYGKESTLALVRGDEPNVEVVDFYNQDYPEAGVRQAGIRVIKEVGPDVTKSEWLPFAIDFAAHSTETKETTEYEVLKITPPSPQANVQVNGYMQIDVVDAPGAPPLEDCDAISEHGRMKVDAREGVSLLYICTSDGWVAK